MAASETNEASSLSRVGAGKAATRNCQASFERSLSRMLNYMSVEPLVLCYLVPAMLFATVLSNLELEKVNYSLLLANRKSKPKFYLQSVVLSSRSRFQRCGLYEHDG